MNSWSGNGPGVGQHRRYSRKLLLARNSKHAHTGSDAAHQTVLAHNLPYCQSIRMGSASPVFPDSSGRCWDSEMPTPRSRGQPPRPQYPKSEQPLCLTVDADGLPSFVDQTMFAVKGDGASAVLWSCLE
jgi:hypothetical protein